MVKHKHDWQYLSAQYKFNKEKGKPEKKDIYFICECGYTKKTEAKGRYKFYDF